MDLHRSLKAILGDADLAEDALRWGGLQGTGGDNELAGNPLLFFELTARIARRRRFSKRAG